MQLLKYQAVTTIQLLEKHDVNLLALKFAKNEFLNSP